MTLKTSLEALGLHHAAAALDDILAHTTREHATPEQMLTQIVEAEHHARRARSFDRRQRRSHVGRVASGADFDWSHPRHIDRALVEEIFALQWLDEGGTAIFVGPSGTGKTHLARSLCLAALVAGRRVVFVHLRVLCDDLAAAETTSALERRLRYYVRPDLLCIDEVAYQQLDLRRLDLLYELVRRRYEARRAVAITACLPFAQWPTVFPSSAATAALVDRLIHRGHIVTIDADSYRRRQAAERAAARK